MLAVLVSGLVNCHFCRKNLFSKTEILFHLIFLVRYVEISTSVRSREHVLEAASIKMMVTSVSHVQTATPAALPQVQSCEISGNV